MILHILVRFGLHFVGATFAVLGFWFALRYWFRRNVKIGNLIRENPELFCAALLVFGLFTLREPYDVAVGQPWYKAISDQFSWLAGAAVSGWGLYRFKRSR